MSCPAGWDRGREGWSGEGPAGHPTDRPRAGLSQTQRRRKPLALGPSDLCRIPGIQRWSLAWEGTTKKTVILQSTTERKRTQASSHGVCGREPISLSVKACPRELGRMTYSKALRGCEKLEHQLVSPLLVPVTPAPCTFEVWAPTPRHPNTTTTKKTKARGTDPVSRLPPADRPVRQPSRGPASPPWGSALGR